MKDDKYFLYWIKRKHHDSILKEGYVGITNNPKLRFWMHKRKAYNNSQYHVHLAISKYEDVEYKIICVGSKEYIVNLEYKLRPESGIGWNIIKGGHLTTKDLETIKDGRIKAIHTNTKLSKIDVMKMIISFNLKGMNIKELSDQFNVSQPTVSRHLYGNTELYPELKIFRDRISGLYKFYPKNLKYMPEKIYNEILEDKEDGLTYKDLKKKYNIPEVSLQKVCYGKYDFVKKFKSFRVVKNTPKKLTYKGVTKTVKQWADTLGLDRKTIWYRENRGYSDEECLSSTKWFNRIPENKSCQ